jgi:UDP-4-amino-4,6-dideoxy-N-acetyl-beta-L-altrosamine N-acetyltransferase
MDLRKNFKLKNIMLLNFINLNDEEKETVRKWRNHEDIKKWMYSSHIISTEEHAVFMEGLKKENKNFYWLARLGSKEYLGIISLNRLDTANKNAYLGIYTNPDSANGAGHMLIDCLKTLAFDIANLHTLKLEVMETNERAINFYRKAGFSEEGRLKEFVFKDGKWLDVIVMGIINAS